MFTTNKSRYVESLLDYINDTKPYHTKLTEVISEYHFYDTINVAFHDSHRLKTQFASIWDKTYVTDGHRARFLTPSYNLPRYSIEANRHHFKTAQHKVPYLRDTLNIDNAFQLRASRGVESAIIDGTSMMAEGIDYHVSKGMYSFKVNTPSDSRSWYQTGQTSNTKDGTLVFQEDPSHPINVSQIDLHPSPQDVDTWTIEQTEISEVVAFDFTIPSTIWNITHNFSSTDLVWQIYVNTPSGLEAILGEVSNITTTSATVSFAQPQTGRVLLFRVPTNGVFQVDTLSSEWNIRHQLATDQIIAEVFAEVNGVLQLIIPQSVKIVDSNYLRVSFSTPLHGKVIILPTSVSRKITTPSTTWIIPLADNNKTPIFHVYEMGVDGLYSQIIPNSIELESNQITITFTQPTTGLVNLSPTDTFAWYKVSSLLYGELGITTSYMPHFYGRGMSCVISGISTNGSKAYIRTTKSNIAIHPEAPEETWTLIKVNPISFNQLVASYVGMPKVDVITATWPNDAMGEDISDPQFDYLRANWTIEVLSVGVSTAIARVSNDLLGFTPIDQTVNISGVSSFDIPSYLRFHLTVGSRGLKVGDTHTFSFGYDTDYFDISGYENAEYSEWSLRGTSFELTRNIPSVKALPLGSAYRNTKPEVWTFTFNERGGYFEVRGSTSGPTEIAWLGKEYDNGFLRIRLVRSDEAFNILRVNETSYMSSYLAGAISNGQLKNGDELYFQTLRDKPNYLVHGSVSGYSNPAIVGEYYWNGKIGFYLSNPTYRVARPDNTLSIGISTGNVSLANGATITFNTPPKFDVDDEQIRLVFHKDAYDNSKLKPIHTVRQFLASSSTRGTLPSVIVGDRYAEWECAEFGPERAFNVDFTIVEGATPLPDTYSLTIDIMANKFKMVHSQEVIIFPNLSNTATSIDINTYQEDILTLYLNSNHPELGSWNDLVPTYLLAATEYDNFSNGYELEIYDNLIGYDTDGTYGLTPPQVDGVDYNSHYLDTPRKQRPIVPDRGYTYEVWLKNVKDSKVGTITWQFDPDALFYRQVIDITDTFRLQYMKLNTSIDINVRQADEYNDLIKVLCSERFDIKIDLTPNEFAHTVVIDHSDLNIHHTHLNSDLTTDKANTHIVDLMKELNVIESNSPSSDLVAQTRVSDNSLSIVSTYDPLGDAGYDMFPYDISGFGLYPEGDDVFEIFTKSNMPITPSHDTKTFSDNIFTLSAELFNFSPTPTIELRKVDTSLLIPGTDFIITEYSNTMTNPIEVVNSYHTRIKSTSPNPSFTFTLLDPQPVTISIV